MIHCAPVAESDSSLWMLGIAIATIVWSMNVIATAKTIAASTRFLFDTTSPHGAYLRIAGGRRVVSEMTVTRRRSGARPAFRLARKPTGPSTRARKARALCRLGVRCA